MIVVLFLGAVPMCCSRSSVGSGVASGSGAPGGFQAAVGVHAAVPVPVAVGDAVVAFGKPVFERGVAS